MELKLYGCSNSGFSLTEVRKKQILELADWVQIHIDDTDKTYKEFQEQIKNSTKSLDESKVRMIVPFLKKMGYFNNKSFKHKNKKSSMRNLFTKEGECFIEYLKVLRNISQLNNKHILQIIDEINELFNIISIINLINNDEKIYLECIKFLKNYKSMDKNEFFIMTTLIHKYGYDDYNEHLEQVISDYKNDAYKKIEIVKNQNAFNYIKKLLLESGLVIQDNTILKLNNKYMYVLDFFK